MVTTGMPAVEEHIVKQYSDLLLYLPAQQESRLVGSYQEDLVVGESKFYDQYGNVEVKERDTRFGDSPIVSTPRDSRRLDLFPYEIGDFIDNFDKARMMHDPTQPIVQRQIEAMARKRDSVVIDALRGDAIVGRKSPTATPLPASQKVAVDNHEFDSGSGDVGMTVGKLIKSKDILGLNNVSARSYHIVCTQRQVSDLLTDERVTSNDYNLIRALISGDVDQYMGYQFHIVDPALLPIVNGDRLVYAYTDTAVMFGRSEFAEAFIAPRYDKRGDFYAYFGMAMGAFRQNEQEVVEIACNL